MSSVLVLATCNLCDQVVSLGVSGIFRGVDLDNNSKFTLLAAAVCH